MFAARLPAWRMRLADFLDARPVKVVTAFLLVASVLPYWQLELRFQSGFLAVFGLQWLLRLLLISGRFGSARRGDYLFVVIDLAVFASFLPLLQVAPALVQTALHLCRLFALLRYARELLLDVYAIVTRREQLDQFVLIGIAIVALAFGSAVLLSQLGISHDYGTSSARSELFVDRLWWSFRQLESADNLVENLAAHPLISAMSLVLTVAGVVIFSFVIGIGASVVGQVIKADRRRPLGFRGHTLVIGPVHDNEQVVDELVRLYDRNRLLRRRDFKDIWDWLFRGAPPPRRHALPRIALLGTDEELPPFLYDDEKRWVAYRHGDPAELSALARVTAHFAKRAIMLAISRSGYDVDAPTLTALSAFREVNPTAHVYVEVLDSRHTDLVTAIGEGGTFPLDVSRFLGLYLCQHIINPGLQAVYQELLTADGSELYTHIFVEPQEIQALSRLGAGGCVSFADVARMAYLEHGVLLTGAFLGEGTPPRLRGRLISSERLVTWLQPETSAGGVAVSRLGGLPGRLPVACLRGLSGLADSYRPLKRFARALCQGRGELTAAAAAQRRLPGIGGLAPAERERLQDALAGLQVSGHGPRRVLVVGYGPSLRALLGELARHLAEVEILLVMNARGGESLAWDERIEMLGLGIDPGLLRKDEARTQVRLEHGGKLTLSMHFGSDLASYAVGQLAVFGAAETAVFLSDPDSEDRDARTSMRVMRFTRALERVGVPRPPALHVVAELAALEKGYRLERHFHARGKAIGGVPVTFTSISTEQLRNYFMVHSAFVPGVMSLFEELLGAGSQQLSRLELPDAAPDLTVTAAALFEAVARFPCLPIGVESRSGSVSINPPPAAPLRLAEQAAVYVVTDPNRLRDAVSQSRDEQAAG
ncbi:MAG: hypothetical protein HYV63_29515 [Candidatus Schekmanbacteria bacterium]|nr:hypothetical protein [Candidatus Schekmanbacteria bacterium]